MPTWFVLWIMAPAPFFLIVFAIIRTSQERERRRTASWYRLNRIDVMLAQVSAHLDLPGVQVDPKVAELLSQGHRLQAIAVYREAHGVNLDEAITVVDRLLGVGA